jgi:hypothetical protein
MQLEFRDGKREVLDHLAVLMRDMETFRMTYQEALDEANKKLQTDFINTAADKFVQEHFRTRERGGF